MGATCSKRAAVDTSPSERIAHANGLGGGMEDLMEKQLSRDASQKIKSNKLEPSGSGKKMNVSEVGSRLGRAGSVGLGKAMEVLDTLGSSMTSLNINSTFASGVATKSNKISILAFEVANTIVKGANLMQSLSKENVKHIKEVVLPSEGVQHLISKDIDELLKIVAADKREELKVFSSEVIRFGNRCKDPQWHNLDRHFDKLGSDITPQNHLRVEAPGMMQQLMALVQYTAELYHELHALDRMEQDYKRKHEEEENLDAVQKGNNLQILRHELKSQRKHVKSLKKKSLWCRMLEEVMEKLVDIVLFLHLEIHDNFGCSDGDLESRERNSNRLCLGPAGLALHYANVICQIDTLVTRSNTVPSSTRDALYQGLPPRIKCSLRAKLQSFEPKEELTVPQIKAEMEKTLQWIVPIANNTTKAHHGFGWVGEWANTGSELIQGPASHTLNRIETLHHADKEKTEAHILDLIVWLHYLISQTRPNIRSPIKSPVRSLTLNNVALPPTANKGLSSTLTREDKEMLREVYFQKLTPGISKSQEFDTVKSRFSKHHRLCKSSSHSASSGFANDFSIRIPSFVPVINFDIDRMKALDAIDRVDTIGKA